ncbi:C40 family peptidase [Nocardioides nitrophenolicus]|uniref:C40 family peptidase n=1 Tax=Nocardioides nitrophenolicus TaxID=60489 RepID=UPI0027DE3B56|nr:NlpC/P60 family protein [Nocardioides nitrophenolicus]MBM7515387.1 cell wall-associated NlpC family hydrolase [Nocardioides nitrophenolicus]
MLNGRTRTTAALAALAVTGAITLSISGSPAQAEPDIETVKARVDRLFHESEQAAERYNDAELELAELDGDLSSLEADQSRQGDALAGVRSDVRDSLIQQYQSGSLGPTGELLSSDSQGFLDELSTLSTVEGLQDSLLADYGDELEAYDIRKEQTEKRRSDINQLKATLAEEKKTADAKLAEAKDLLSQLEAEQRAEFLSRNAGRPIDANTIPASGRAAVAIKYALAQVGDAYVWGAAGPNAFDCSGLTMMAYAQANVSLPHSSRAQYGSGAHVAKSDLQAGDLVFYYSPISHVGIYLGNGLIVHAANPGAGVKVSDLDEMPYAGAVRPG